MVSTKPKEVALLFGTFVIAICGLVYELLEGTISSYLLGDSIYHFSLVIGLFMSSMGIGAWLSRFIDDKLERAFILLQMSIALVGGFLALVLLAGLLFGVGVQVLAVEVGEKHIPVAGVFGDEGLSFFGREDKPHPYDIGSHVTFSCIGRQGIGIALHRGAVQAAGDVLHLVIIQEQGRIIGTLADVHYIHYHRGGAGPGGGKQQGEGEKGRHGGVSQVRAPASTQAGRAGQSMIVGCAANLTRRGRKRHGGQSGAPARSSRRERD